MNNVEQRHSAIDLLRGFAALSVAWYHFTTGNTTFLPDGALQASGSYGWLGVEIFFVISGFIIPFALARSQYHISDYGTFLLKRIVRLDPPYLVSILLTVVIGYGASATPWFRGPEYHVSLPQLLLHLGYANVLFGYDWLNPVFWTLAIELQYYLLVGLLFPLLLSRTTPLRWGTMVLLAASSIVLPAQQFLFHWLLLFLMGIVTFQYRAHLLDLRLYLGVLAVLGVTGVYVYGVVITIAGLATACIIAFARMNGTGRLAFFGHISYSLYLLHFPIGVRITHLSERFVHGLPGKCAVLFAAFVVSVGAAWLLYRLVELPSQRWSSSIGYKRGKVAPSGFAPRQG